MTVITTVNYDTISSKHSASTCFVLTSTNLDFENCDGSKMSSAPYHVKYASALNQQPVGDKLTQDNIC